jgi:SAM-dependent methyltransferase
MTLDQCVQKTGTASRAPIQLWFLAVPENRFRAQQAHLNTGSGSFLRGEFMMSTGSKRETPEFDKYADQYSELLRDPIRERFAPGSTFFFERKWKLLTEYLARTGMAAKGTHWLDVGCGHGDLLRIGAPDVASAVGCDLSSEMLESCADLNVVSQTEPTRLPFDDSRFNLITAVCVYHHVPIESRPALTSEIVRLLRLGGVACIIEHNPFNPVTQLIVRRTPVDADARLLTAGSTRRLLSAAQLRALETAYFLYFPEGWYRKLARLESMLAGIPGGGQYAVFARK